MYYVISDNGQIVESYDRRPTQEQLQADADYFNCEVYVIDGEHTGLTASPKSANEEGEEDNDD